MKEKLFFAVVLLLVSAQTLNSQVESDTTLSYEMVENSVRELGKSGIRERNIYLLLDRKGHGGPAELNRLAQLFRSVQTKFCHPYNLQITAFDSLPNLGMQIENDRKQTFVDFPYTEDGRRNAAEFAKGQGPPLSGYFRAVYYRNLGYELLDFSPAIDEVNLKRIDLGSRFGKNLTNEALPVCVKSKK